MAAEAGGGLVHGATKENVPTRAAVLGLAADPTEKNAANLLLVGNEATHEACRDPAPETGTDRPRPIIGKDLPDRETNRQAKKQKAIALRL